MNVGSTSVNQFTCFAGRSLKWMLGHEPEIGKRQVEEDLFRFEIPGLILRSGLQCAAIPSGDCCTANPIRSCSIFRPIRVDDRLRHSLQCGLGESGTAGLPFSAGLGVESRLPPASYALSYALMSS